MAHQKVLNPEATNKADEESFEEKKIVQPIIDLKSMPTMRDKNLQSDSDSDETTEQGLTNTTPTSNRR